LFANIINKLRQVLYKMKLTTGYQKINDIKGLNYDEIHYNKIALWKALYAGLSKDIHKIHYQTLEGKKKRWLKSLKMPKIVCEELARLVYNEKCEININDPSSNEEGEGEFSEYIKGVLKENRFDAIFQSQLEKNFAMGGLVAKAHVKDEKIQMVFVSADSFIPTMWRNGKVYAGVFVNSIKKGQYYYTHLEKHEWDGDTYFIRNELYRSEDSTSIGIRVNLAELFPDIEEEVPVNGLDRPLFVYTKPNIANNFDTESPLGVSIFANCIDTIESLDRAFDSFNREFRLGAKRIIVPASSVKVVPDPVTKEYRRYFDPTDEVYQAFDFTEDTDQIKDISVEIRADEHIKGIQALLDILAMQVGFSAGAFNFDGEGIKTATEVISEKSKTFRTVVSHEVTVEEFIVELIEVIRILTKLYKLARVPEEIEVNINFDDSIIKDDNADLDYYAKLKSHGFISSLKAMMMLRNLSEDEAKEELALIKEEQSIDMPEIGDLMGEE